MYFIIFWFILFHDMSNFITFINAEFFSKAKFSWFRLIRYLLKGNRANFIVWWRLANYMNSSKRSIFRRTASKIQNNLIAKYNVEIELGATIGIGLKVHHYSSIIITKYAVIGNNFTCYQNVTIGWRKDPYKILIGDNVTMGCGSTILGGEISIGNNVKIGAMSLVLGNIPNDCTYITKHQNDIIHNKNP